MFSTLKQIANSEGNKSLRALCSKHKVESLKGLLAWDVMQRSWLKLGGPKSPVGLPILAEIETSQIQSAGWQSEFRSGSLRISSDGITGTSIVNRLVSITLVGIECGSRQEKTDEMYGVIGVLGASNSTIFTRRFPESGTIEFGQDGLRIQNLGIKLLDKGTLQDYTIIATLIENDSGDVDTIANDISGKISSLVAEGIEGLTGVPAESVSESDGFKSGLTTGLKFLFGNILGIGDDPYNPENKTLFAFDLIKGAPPLQPPYKRSDDPRTIDKWNLKMLLSGQDDGGDIGNYALYFFVEVVTDTQTELFDTPSN